MRVLALLASMPLLAAACASTEAARARRETLTAQLDGLRYARPLDEVWREVRLLLAAKGYPLAGEDARAAGGAAAPGGVVGRLVSPARATRPYEPAVGVLEQLGVLSGDGRAAPKGLSLDTGWGRDGDRLHADALDLPDGVRVVLWRFEEDQGLSHPKPPERDLATELALARRLDPVAAERIDGVLARPTGSGR